MENLLKLFDNRELAFLTWISVVLIGALLLKPFRTFLTQAFKIITSKTFLIMILLLISYLILLIWGISKINLRDINLIKDTVYWLIGVGFIMTFNSIGKDITYFKTIIIDTLKLTIIIEFIANLYVFSYIAELISIPIMAFFVILQTVNELKVKSKGFGKLMNFIIGLYGFAVLLYASYRTIESYRLEFTIENLQSLLLPSVLTIFFIPFSYFVSLYSAYETAFIKLTNVKNRKYSNARIKWEIIKRSKLSLSKTREINIGINPYYINLTTDINEYFENIKKTSC